MLHEHFGLLDWEPWTGTWPLHVGHRFFIRFLKALWADQDEMRAAMSAIAQLWVPYRLDGIEHMRIATPGGVIRLIPDLAD